MKMKKVRPLIHRIWIWCVILALVSFVCSWVVALNPDTFPIEWVEMFNFFYFGFFFFSITTSSIWTLTTPKEELKDVETWAQWRERVKAKKLAKSQAQDFEIVD